MRTSDLTNMSCVVIKKSKSGLVVNLICGLTESRIGRNVATSRDKTVKGISRDQETFEVQLRPYRTFHIARMQKVVS